MTEASADPSTRVDLTTEIVSAYVSWNPVPVAELPRLIRSVHESLTGLGSSPAAEAPAKPLKPAVPIKKSITDEFIISLEDGRKLKAMRRYLGTLGMTPEDYRRKWGLPADYPMVAPGYAAQRSALAKTLGLGRKAAPAIPEPDPAPEPDLPGVASNDAPAKKQRKGKAAAAA